MFRTSFGRVPLGLRALQRPTPLFSLASKIQRCTVVSRAAKQVSPPEEPPKIEPPSPQHKAYNRFPKFMRKYAVGLAEAPASHIAAFLFVHELTAIVPLFAIWGGFWYFDYVPVGLPDWVIEKGSMFIRQMAERNDWTVITNAELGSRLVLQGAAAYAIVKALLPVRLLFSLWAMPWTAKWLVIPFTNTIGGLFRRAFTQKP